MGTRRTGRHCLPARARQWPVEPAQWLVSNASRGWYWVWSVDHDDLVSTAVARVLQFGLLAAFFLAMVIGAR